MLKLQGAYHWFTAEFPTDPMWVKTGLPIGPAPMAGHGSDWARCTSRAAISTAATSRGPCSPPCRSTTRRIALGSLLFFRAVQAQHGHRVAQQLRHADLAGRVEDARPRGLCGTLRRRRRCHEARKRLEQMGRAARGRFLLPLPSRRPLECLPWQCHTEPRPMSWSVGLAAAPELAGHGVGCPSSVP